MFSIVEVIRKRGQNLDKSYDVVDNLTKQSVETLICDDGRNDFLAFSGIAKECKEYWFDMYIANEWIRKKGYVCQKFDGSWEMVTPRQ